MFHKKTVCFAFIVCSRRRANIYRSPRKPQLEGALDAQHFGISACLVVVVVVVVASASRDIVRCVAFSIALTRHRMSEARAPPAANAAQRHESGLRSGLLRRMLLSVWPASSPSGKMGAPHDAALLSNACRLIASNVGGALLGVIGNSVVAAPSTAGSQMPPDSIAHGFETVYRTVYAVCLSSDGEVDHPPTLAAFANLYEDTLRPACRAAFLSYPTAIAGEMRLGNPAGPVVGNYEVAVEFSSVISRNVELLLLALPRVCAFFVWPVRTRLLDSRSRIGNRQVITDDHSCREREK